MATYQQNPGMHRVCVHCDRSRDAHYFHGGALHCPGEYAEIAKAAHIADLIEHGAELPHIHAKLRASLSRKPDLCMARAIRAVGCLTERHMSDPDRLKSVLLRAAALADYIAKD